MHDTIESKIEISTGIEVLNDIERKQLIGDTVYVHRSGQYYKCCCNLSQQTFSGTRQKTSNTIVNLIPPLIYYHVKKITQNSYNNAKTQVF